MPARCLLYYITDRTALAADEPTRRRRLLEKIAEAAQAEVDYIQLREKDLSARDLESLAGEAVVLLDKLRTKNPELRTALLINSRTDVAQAVEADGVHVRSDDISPKEVKVIWQNSSCGRGRLARAASQQPPLIAVSCHSPAEVKEAAAQAATFAVFAPVFEKKDFQKKGFEKKEPQPAGLAALEEACRAKIPVLALGGITLANSASCLEAGAAGVAGIRLFQENNIEQIVRALREPLQ
ncbi:MAG TPA: thiamine phosphate synthase [Terriglobales bacterium]|nr:thiamine phosphate synthase [Terriglobales bacterium]